MLHAGRTLPVIHVGKRTALASASHPSTIAAVEELEDIISLRDEEILQLKKQLGTVWEDRAEQAFTRRWSLTGKEAALLASLYAARGRVVCRDVLFSTLYPDPDSAPEVKIIDVFVCKVRAKAGHGLIETIWGRGYSLTATGIDTCEALAATPLYDIAPVAAVGPRTREDDPSLRRVLQHLLDNPLTTSSLSGSMGLPHARTYALLVTQRRRGLVRVGEDGVPDCQGRKTAVAWTPTEAGKLAVAA